MTLVNAYVLLFCFAGGMVIGRLVVRLIIYAIEQHDKDKRQ